MVKESAAHSVVEFYCGRKVKKLFTVVLVYLKTDVFEILILESAEHGTYLGKHILTSVLCGTYKILNVNAVCRNDCTYEFDAELCGSFEVIKCAANLYNRVLRKVRCCAVNVVPVLSVYFSVLVGKDDIQVFASLC